MLSKLRQCTQKQFGLSALTSITGIERFQIVEV